MLLAAQLVLFLVLDQLGFLNLELKYYLKKCYSIFINHSFLKYNFHHQFTAFKLLEIAHFHVQNIFQLIPKLNNSFQSQQSVINYSEYHSCDLFTESLFLELLMECEVSYLSDHFNLILIIKFCMFNYLHFNSGLSLQLQVKNFILLKFLTVVHSEISLLFLIRCKVYFQTILLVLVEQLQLIFNSYRDLLQAKLSLYLNYFNFHRLFKFLFLKPIPIIHHHKLLQVLSPCYHVLLV